MLKATWDSERHNFQISKVLAFSGTLAYHVREESKNYSLKFNLYNT